jgi:hypothetical protein
MPAFLKFNENKEASRTRVLCVAKNATHGAARPDPSQRKKRAAQDDNRAVFVWT